MDLPPDSEVLFVADGNCLLRHSNAYIQIRAGEVRHDVLEEVERQIAAVPDGIAFIGVIEPGAPISQSSARRRQHRLVREGLQRVASSAVCIAGDDIGSVLMRSFVRLMAPGSKQFRITADVASAVDWVRPVLAEGTEPEQLCAVIEAGRELLRR